MRRYAAGNGDVCLIHWTSCGGAGGEDLGVVWGGEAFRRFVPICAAFEALLSRGCSQWLAALRTRRRVRGQRTSKVLGLFSALELFGWDLDALLEPPAVETEFRYVCPYGQIWPPFAIPLKNVRNTQERSLAALRTTGEWHGITSRPDNSGRWLWNSPLPRSPVALLDGVSGVLDGAVLDGESKRRLSAEARVQGLPVDFREHVLDPRAVALVHLGIGRFMQSA